MRNPYSPTPSPSRSSPMRLLHLYLLAYFALLAAAGLVLWQAGVVQRVPSTWLILAAIVTLGLGCLLALVARSKPLTTGS
jgi:hypothetical protein